MASSAAHEFQRSLGAIARAPGDPGLGENPAAVYTALATVARAAELDSPPASTPTPGLAQRYTVR